MFCTKLYKYAEITLQSSGMSPTLCRSSYDTKTVTTSIVRNTVRECGARKSRLKVYLRYLTHSLTHSLRK